MPDPAQGMIRLDFVVTDTSGHPVTGLTGKDFTLLDNGKQQKILSFQAFDQIRDKPNPPVTVPMDIDGSNTAEPDPPLEVILVIDELNMPDVPQQGGAQLLSAEREAENFLRRNQGHLGQPVSIYRVTKDGLSASQPSTDGNSLADDIAHRREPRVIWKRPMISESLGKIAGGGETSRRITHSLIALGSIAIEERRKPGRKLMFWLGPGWQTNGRAGTGLFDFSTELSTRLREARIDLWSATEWPLYDARGNPVPASTFIFKDYLEGVRPETYDFGYLALHIIATQSGGGVLATSNDLASLIGKRADQASAFYSLTFDPPRTNVVDEYHALNVEVGKPGLTAHTRTGYFDEPVFYDQALAGIERVTVEQLENALKMAGGRSDSSLAQQLAGLELTERVNTTRLAMLETTLKGKKARQALVALADASVFLAPPAGEIPTTPPPDAARQRQMISRTVDYVNKTIPKLPDFFADRTVVQYHEYPPKPGQTWKTAMGDQSLHIGETAKAVMHFRNGKEVVEGEVIKGKLSKHGGQKLDSVGNFGPILNTVVVGATAANSIVIWSRWEQSAKGPQAVFRYRVPEETPFFLVGSAYLANDDKMIPFERKAPFHGEFAVDPASGAILRLTVQADLEPRLPLDRSDVMVEYKPVVVGGNTYICPARSVSILRQRTVMDIHEWGETFKIYAPFETLLNDMVFEKYHKFHSTSRILPGFTPEPEDK
jgi:VWFA-related protein